MTKITFSDEYERRAAAAVCECSGIIASVFPGEMLTVEGFSPHSDATLLAIIAATADDMRPPPPPPSKWEVFNRRTGQAFGVFLARDGAGARAECAKHCPEADPDLLYAEEL